MRGFSGACGLDGGSPTMTNGSAAKTDRRRRKRMPDSARCMQRNKINLGGLDENNVEHILTRTYLRIFIGFGDQQGDTRPRACLGLQRQRAGHVLQAVRSVAESRSAVGGHGEGAGHYVVCLCLAPRVLRVGHHLAACWMPRRTLVYADPLPP